MPPTRTSSRFSLASSASSASDGSPSIRSQRAAAHETPTSAKRSAVPSISAALSRSIRTSPGPSTPQNQSGKSPSAKSNPVGNNYDDPIIVLDSDNESEPSTLLDGNLSSARVSRRAVTPLPSMSPSSTSNPDDIRSTTTLDQSYATSLTSDFHLVSDSTLSSISSDDSDSDAPAKTVPRAAPGTTPQRRSTRPMRTASATSTPAPRSSGSRDPPSQTPSETPTPSRRSARIVSSGSSVQKALQRRDELDAKLLASGVRRKPESPEALSTPPLKRGRSGYRIPASEISHLKSHLSPSALLPPSVESTILLSDSGSSRRSARLSLPSTLAASPSNPTHIRKGAIDGVTAHAPSQEPQRKSRLGRQSQGTTLSTSVTRNAAPPEQSAASTSKMDNRLDDRATSTNIPAVATPPVRRRLDRPGNYDDTEELTTRPVSDVGASTRLTKRNLSDLRKLADASANPAHGEETEEPSGRKRGRSRKSVDLRPEVAVASPVKIAGAGPISRQEAIEMLDDNVSELSDTSDQTTQSPASSQQVPPPRRRGRPPKDRTLETGSLKRVSRAEKNGKKYHVSGLYAGEAEATASVPSNQPAEAPNAIFPLPIHFGAQLLVEERDFCLPRPIHQTMDQLRERVHAKRKPPRFQHISKNKYYSRPKLQGEVPLCSCKPGSRCASDCINRMLMFICDPRTCPNGSSCTNISLGRRPGIKTTVAYYGRRGFGLKTLEPVKRDDFIDEYRGEVINLSEAAKRVTEEYKATGNYYLLDYDSAAGELLDGGRKGNITRFANHSCDPNCRIEKFIICGTDEALSAEFQIGLFANRDIEAGEEITYNYGWAAFQPRDNITGAPTAQVPTEQCLCGAANCSGILGGKKAPVTKATAADMAAGSRKKAAKGKGRGKAKGKRRKTAQTASRTRLRAMTPMMSAARLAAAAMPGSARLTPAASRTQSRREETQANLITKIVLKRRERSARMAVDASASNSDQVSRSDATRDASAGEERTTGTLRAKDAVARVVEVGVTAKAKAPNELRLPLATPARYGAQNVPNAPAGTSASSAVTQANTTKHAFSSATVASGSGKASSAIPSASTAKRAPATEVTVASGSRSVQPALSNATDNNTSPTNSRMLLVQRLASSRLANNFIRPATVARGTKDRRWSAAQAMVSDNEDESWDHDMSDSEDRGSDFQRRDTEAQPSPADPKTAPAPKKRGRRKLQLTPEEAERRTVDRRARNAFLARVRRASKRGIEINDPTQHPLKKISIPCTAAPENTYIPDLPSSLVTLGMSTGDARRARNAFLARVRRAVKRGYPKDVAIKLAAKPLPGDETRDTPVMRAQRAYQEQLEREAIDELAASTSAGRRAADNARGNAEGQSTASTADGWVDESSWTAAQVPGPRSAPSSS